MGKKSKKYSVNEFGAHAYFMTWGVGAISMIAIAI